MFGAETVASGCVKHEKQLALIRDDARDAAYAYVRSPRKPPASYLAPIHGTKITFVTRYVMFGQPGSIIRLTHPHTAER
ncbi:hypothetical protein CUJ91_18370 [Paraburkholderia graminis]|nr:hypothetical protein CUJ91_18370 [Paraburkholderia graminis]